MEGGDVWEGPGDLVIHCQNCHKYPADLPPRPTPYDEGNYGHPSCLLIRPGETIPAIYKGWKFDGSG